MCFAVSFGFASSLKHLLLLVLESDRCDLFLLATFIVVFVIPIPIRISHANYTGAEELLNSVCV